MKSILILGVVLVIAGVLALTYRGITYTRQKQVAQVGSVHLTTRERKSIPLPPALGVAAVGVGAMLIVMGVRRG